MKLDYSLKKQDRVKLVNEILLTSPNLTQSYIDILSDYIISAETRVRNPNREQAHNRE